MRKHLGRAVLVLAAVMLVGALAVVATTQAQEPPGSSVEPESGHPPEDDPDDPDRDTPTPTPTPTPIPPPPTPTPKPETPPGGGTTPPGGTTELSLVKQPQNLRTPQSRITHNSITLMWDPVKGAASYITGRRVDVIPGPSNQAEGELAAATVATEHTFRRMLSDTCYWLTVRGVGNGTTHRTSPGPQATTRACTLPKPTPPETDPPPPSTLPVVTIARHSTTPAAITEGTSASFAVSVSPVSKTDLTVLVSVADRGGVIRGVAPSQVVIPKGVASGQVLVHTQPDKVDEDPGKVTVTVLPSVQSTARYSVGTPVSASVIVADDDAPKPPTDVRVNGRIIGGKIAARWSHVPRSITYKVWYAPCADDGCPTQPTWTEPTDLQLKGAATKEATFSLPSGSDKKLYQIAVQAVNSDALNPSSSRSDFAAVYPTSSSFTDDRLAGLTTVATAPFHGYLPLNSVGSHEFRYVLCTETIPSYITEVSHQDMKDAVATWPAAVKWKRTGGHNIISATSYSLEDGKKCGRFPRNIPKPGVYPPPGRFEIRFVSSSFIGFTCTPTPACWRSASWGLDLGKDALARAITIDRIKSGTIFINSGLGEDHWQFDMTAGCKRLFETIVHEAGHAYGIGRAPDDHPDNPTDSVMSNKSPGAHCGPGVYDAVALMALYQTPNSSW